METFPHLLLIHLEPNKNQNKIIEIKNTNTINACIQFERIIG